MTKQELTEQTIALWQPRTSRQLSNEDAREIAENLSGFFAVLAEWSRNENRAYASGTADHANATNAGGVEQ